MIPVAPNDASCTRSEQGEREREREKGENNINKMKKMIMKKKNLIRKYTDVDKLAQHLQIIGGEALENLNDLLVVLALCAHQPQSSSHGKMYMRSAAQQCMFV